MKEHIGIADTKDNRKKLFDYMESLSCMESAGILACLWDGIKEQIEDMLMKLINSAPIVDTLEEDFEFDDMGLNGTLIKAAEKIMDFGSSAINLDEDLATRMIFQSIFLGFGSDNEVDLDDMERKVVRRIENFVSDKDVAERIIGRVRDITEGK